MESVAVALVVLVRPSHFARVICRCEKTLSSITITVVFGDGNRLVKPRDEKFCWGRGTHRTGPGARHRNLRHKYKN